MKSLCRSLVLVALFALPFAISPALGEEIPRTASGKPDFSGTYDISTVTPWARPEAYGERMSLTDEEAAEIVESRRKRAEALQANSDPERGAPPAGANVGAYNDFWMDWGTGNFKLDGKYRTSVIIDPPNGRMPEPTQVAIDNFQNGPKFDWGRNDGTAWWMETDGPKPYDDPEFNTLGVRCIYQDATTIPIRSLPYNNVYRIVQTETHVVLNVEWMHTARVITLQGEHPPEEIQRLAGDSIGWFEGDKLVVETSNFRSMLGAPQNGMKVRETFSHEGNGDLRYHFTVEDPRYAGPYTGEMLWPDTEAKQYEYACHEGNYAMGGQLRGARLLEKEWQKQKGGATDDD